MIKKKVPALISLIFLAQFCMSGTLAQQESIEHRIENQRARIKHALLLGRMNQEDARRLNQEVSAIEDETNRAKAENGGALKPEQHKAIENRLNQNSNLIMSTAKANDSTVQSGKVLGPDWSKGKDGAQDPKALKKKMKLENRRELRQERQATEQKIEQQQLEYEREMVERLGEQKKDILKQKSDLKEVRQESGAD